MPKPMYVWSGSAWVSVAAEVESLATYATQSYAAAQPGMKMVVPTSVAVGSGSGSVDTNGAVTFSGASSVSLNDCFSSTYQNYKIVMNLSAATSNDVQMRLRVSSTDAATNYNRRGLCVDSAGTVSNYGSANSGTFWYAGIQTASLNSAGEILLSSPRSKAPPPVKYKPVE